MPLCPTHHPPTGTEVVLFTETKPGFDMDVDMESWTRSRRTVLIGSQGRNQRSQKLRYLGENAEYIYDTFRYIIIIITYEE